MVNILRQTLLALGLICVVLVLAYFGLPYYIFGRFTIPKSAEYVDRAKSWVPIVQAICDYRADHGGLYPEELSDLAPQYIPVFPRGGYPSLSGDYFSVAAGMPHTGIIYSFNPADEGWSVQGDFGVGQLSLPKITTSHPALSADARSAARLAEIERRIGLHPDALKYRIARYNELMVQGKIEEVMAFAEDDVAVFPEWWRPPLIAAWLAPPLQRQLIETRFREWVAARPAFLYYWYLAHYYQERRDADSAIAALEQAVKYPLKRVDDDADFPPSAYGFDATLFAYQQRRFELALNLIRRWASPIDLHAQPGDDWLPLKAASELALARFAEADADARKITEQPPPASSAGNLPELLKAITARDQSFVYIPGPPSAVWTLFEKPE